MIVCLELFPQLFKSGEWHPARDGCSGNADIIESVERESIGQCLLRKRVEASDTELRPAGRGLVLPVPSRRQGTSQS